MPRSSPIFRLAVKSLVLAGFLGLLAAPSVFAQSADKTPDAPEAERRVPNESPARIEVAFVLDTTGSMTGLIEGAKKKIWSIAGNMIDLEPQPEIRIALIGYRDRGDAYVTKRFDLTTDVQTIYGELLAFRAQGGGDNPESVNQALAEAVNDLSWSQEDSVFRAVFLVGDAPPHMDYENDVPFPETLAVAVKKDIIVNAVQAGGQSRTTKVWRRIAKLGGGEYAQIAQDGAMTAISSPFDEEIETLNRKLSDTVVPYGAETERRAAAEKRDRAKAATGASAADMNRYFSKLSGERARKVISGGGDLVEDVDEGRVEIEKIEEKALPAPMRSMTPAERRAYIAGRAAERASIRAKLDALLKKRAAFIAERRAEASAAPDAFDARVDLLIKEQAAKKGYR